MLRVVKRLPKTTQRGPELSALWKGFYCCLLLLGTTEILGLSLGSSLHPVTDLGPCAVLGLNFPISRVKGLGESSDFYTILSCEKGRERS